MEADLLRHVRNLRYKLAAQQGIITQIMRVVRYPFAEPHYSAIDDDHVNRCTVCFARPIVGVRLECKSCNIQMCERCFALTQHDPQYHHQPCPAIMRQHQPPAVVHYGFTCHGCRQVRRVWLAGLCLWCGAARLLVRDWLMMMCGLARCSFPSLGPCLAVRRASASRCAFGAAATLNAISDCDESKPVVERHQGTRNPTMTKLQTTNCRRPTKPASLT